ncbi:hypothetical protein B4U80_12080, partial [Leptotrombidium deliense]
MLRMVRAKYVVYVIDVDGIPRTTIKSPDVDGSIFSSGGTGRGSKYMCRKAMILDNRSRILHFDSSLNIYCEIIYIGEIWNVSSGAIYTDSDFVDGSLENDFKLFNITREGADVIIEDKDGNQLKAHKLILQIRSKVMQNMFANNTIESTTNKIIITDIAFDVLYEMVNYVYCDSVDEVKLPLIAHELLLAAEKYEIVKLKKICENFMAQNINKENCNTYLIIADRCRCEKLKQILLNFIAMNPETIDYDNFKENTQL